MDGKEMFGGLEEVREGSDYTVCMYETVTWHGKAILKSSGLDESNQYKDLMYYKKYSQYVASRANSPKRYNKKLQDMKEKWGKHIDIKVSNTWWIKGPERDQGKQ